MLSSFFRLGKTSIKKTILNLFIAGFIPIIYLSYEFGKFIYSSVAFNKTISSTGSIKVTQETGNIYVGILAGIAIFIFYLVLWKVVCELLLAIFKYLEVKFVEKDKSSY